MSEALELSQADWLVLERATYQESLYEFVKASWHILEPGRPLIENWHLEAVCSHLEACAKGKITRLAISIPPGHSKSLLAAVFFNAWVWTWAPHKRFLSTGSSEDFCTRDNGKLRTLIKSDWYQARWPMEFPQVDTVLRFENNKTGFRWGKSFTSLTGGRANFLILDDVLPVDKGNSDVERATVNRRFFESATSRLEDERDAIIIIMQRVHESDLIGEIMERQKKGQNLGFEFLIIPMEFEGDANATGIGWKDPRTKIGELICPAYRSQAFVDREKETMGAYAWSAQYNQEPVPRGNGLFRREDFQLYDPSKPNDLPPLNYYITSDHALGSSSRGDYNVVRVWGIDPQKNLWLVDSLRERCSIQSAIGIKRENGKTVLLAKGALPFIKRYKPIAWFADADAIIRSNEQLVKSSMIETGAICRFEIVNQGNQNKEHRASAFQNMSALGMIYLPDNYIGEAALAEYCAFPAGRFDDQIDSDGILPRLATHPAVIPPPPKTGRRDDFYSHEEIENNNDSYDCW